LTNSKRKDVVNSLYRLSSPLAVKPSDFIYTGMQLTSATLTTIIDKDTRPPTYAMPVAQR